MNEEIVEKLHQLVYSNLLLKSPMLSGNMVLNISNGTINSSYCEIIIDAPFYDMKIWERDKVIVHTGKTYRGRTAYAKSVNDVGAFGTHNKSENWVNRAVLEVVQTIANEIGAEVINEIRI